MTSGIKAWPLETFKDETVINDTVGAVKVVLIGDENTRTVRAYERKNHEFSKDLKTTDNQSWTLNEDHLVSSDGETLERLPGHISYWFAWAGYLGDETSLYK